jgi:SWI/SNF-related matrix-associated actin-dependent regulator 1 of chromatin subfamily A
MLHEFFEHMPTMRRALGMSKVWGAVEVVSEILDETREKVIVFAHHQSVIDRLMELLAGFAPVKIDGRTSPAERQKSIDTFLDDPRCRVFIGNIQAAGTSITLVGPNCAVSNVVFVESSFSPGDNVQAASRIHRIGQHSAVQVWFLTAAGTYDERIMEIVSRKAKDFHVLFDQKT